MIDWTDEQLKEVGIDKRKLKALIRRLEQAQVYLDALGLNIYAAGGDCCLWHDSRPHHDDSSEPGQDCVVAFVKMNIDGGDW